MALSGRFCFGSAPIPAKKEIVDERGYLTALALDFGDPLLWFSHNNKYP
jgi:hypothetical protein